MATSKSKPSKKSTPVKGKVKKEVANKKANVSKVTEKKLVTKQKVANKSAVVKSKAKKEKAIKPIVVKPLAKKEKAIDKPIVVKPSVKKVIEPTPVVVKVSKKEVVSKEETKEIKKMSKDKKKSTSSSSELPKKEAVSVPEVPTAPIYTDEEMEQMRKDHFVKEGTRLGANFSMSQTSKDIEAIIAYFCKQTPNTSYAPFELSGKAEVETVVPVAIDRISELRKELTTLGVGFAPAHTEHDLEQLLNAVRGAGVTVESRKSFELTLDNLDSIKGNPSTPAPFNPTVQVGQAPSFLGTSSASSSDVSSVDKGQLEMYRNIFMGTINNHFRLMSKNELVGLFAQANYPFTYVINNHPEQGNKIEIILTSGKYSLRLPNDNANDWVNING